MKTDLQKLFDRALEVAASPALGAIRQRLATTAGELSLAGQMQAHLDVCVSAMVALIGVMYDTDADGRPANYDRVTGRILLRPLPWGESGGIKWGLRRWESVCLRRLLLDRTTQKRRWPALFDYNEFSRQWHIATDSYPDSEAALRWLQSDGPTLDEWRTIVLDYRTRSSERMAHKRNKEWCANSK